MKNQRHFVDPLDVFSSNNRLFFDVTKMSDFRFDSSVEDAIRPTQKNIGLNSKARQLLYAMLSRFGLKFPSAGNIRHQGQVNIQHVLSAPVPGELSDRFQERESFDVTDRSADLANCDIVTLGGGENSPLDLVRYGGNHMHCAA